MCYWNIVHVYKGHLLHTSELGPPSFQVLCLNSWEINGMNERNEGQVTIRNPQALPIPCLAYRWRHTMPQLHKIEFLMGGTYCSEASSKID